MTPFSIRHRPGWPGYIRNRPGWPGYLWVVAALVGLLRVATAADTEPTGPRITDCRVGFAGVYKVGHWTPVWVDVAGADALNDPRVAVTVNDSDGVPATVSAAVPKSPSPNAPATVALSTQVGRMGGRISVSLVSDGAVVDRVELQPRSDIAQASKLNDLPATGELLVAVGSAPFGWDEAFATRDAESGQVVRRSVQLKHIAELPTTWFGYEAVDVLVLSVGDGALCRELAADAPRLTALRRWVELGGRLVILCGGDAAEELLADGQPLSALVPGRFAGVVGLAQTGPLEHFSESAAQIAGRGARVELRVPKLVDVTGQIEAYAGQQPTDLPLVVRGPLGLGEVAIAGVDLSAPPLADWPGRINFLRALLRPYVAKTETSEAPQSLMTLGYNDLSGALRQRLGSTFVNVTTLKFPAVASLAIAYLLILGPGDYWLVHKVLRRPGAAWVTFPLLVIATSVGAYAVAGWSKGSTSTRVNQVQLVDFDVATGRARGTYWAALYSPESRRYDLGLSSQQVGEEVETLLTSWGLTGAGIGGMDARNVDLGITRTGYRYAPDLDALEAVPILTASTKSLLGRWTALARPLVEARLVDDDELAVGSVTNRTGQPLRNARLLYGTWAYRLGNLADGQKIDVGQHLDTIQVKTMVARSAGIAADQLSGETERSMFFSDRASADELLNLVMFYHAAGGQAFSQLPSRYQAYCDLSRLLELGRAILVAEAPGPGRQLIGGAGGEPFGQPGGTSIVVYRFVLPVEKSTEP